MTLLLRLIVSLILAAAATYLLQLSTNSSQATFSLMTLAILFVACFSTAIISPAISVKASAKPARKSSNSNREQGKVKWFNVSKGYGFVTRASGEDVFVHFRSIQGKGRRALREGQTIEFTVVEGDKGPQAEEVSPVE